MNLDGRALVRGITVGLVVIVPVSVAVEALERNVDDLDGSPWLFIPFVAILGAYVLAGRFAAMAAPASPLTHAALAAFGAFVGWMVVRVLVPVIQGNDLDIGAAGRGVQRDVRGRVRRARRGAAVESRPGVALRARQWRRW